MNSIQSTELKYEMEKNELNCGKGCEPERQWELWVIH